MDFKQTCRLCLNFIRDKNFEVIDHIKKDILNVILLKLNIDEKQIYIMCGTCCRKLYTAFEFKLVCLSTDDTIIPYVNLEELTVDLSEISMKEKGINISHDQQICRLCMQPVKEFILIDELEFGMFEKYIPEMNFSITKDPVICYFCSDIIISNSYFMKNCLDVEKRIKLYFGEKITSSEINVAHSNVNIKLEKPEGNEELTSATVETEIDFGKNKEFKNIEGLIKIGERQIKTEKMEDESLHQKEVYKSCRVTAKRKNVIKTKASRHPLSIKGSNSSSDNKAILKTNIKSKATFCIYKTADPKLNINRRNSKRKPRKSLKDTLKHAFEVQCDVSDDKSRNKRNSKRHTSLDKKERKLYECDKCKYKTTSKILLNKHTSYHIYSSERQWYKCNVCDFKSIWKYYLPVHMLVHEDPSKIQWTTCEICNRKLKHKHNMARHMQTHEKVSGIQWYQCEKCEFKTRGEYNLMRHMLVHKVASAPTDI